MGLAVKKSQRVSKREKVCRFMDLRGVTDWFEGKLAVYYQPVASVPDAPSFIDLMDLDVKKEELLELLIDICAGYWENESELDEVLFDQYMKAKLDEKAQAFKRTTMQ
ncbi:MAG: hypothetical protein HYS66_05980 [Deltaproteobacteria bacterium]|nr:hypothetical protein [Deltaproteobacteria bacterium]